MSNGNGADFIIRAIFCCNVVMFSFKKMSPPTFMNVGTGAKNDLYKKEPEPKNVLYKKKQTIFKFSS